MIKVGALKFRTILLCDDIRTEKGNNKIILIGVYSGDILLSELPAEIQLSFYLEVVTPPGKYDVELRLSGPQKAQAILKAQFEGVNEESVGTIASPRLTINLEKEGAFRIDARIAGGRWVKLISKKVIENPNALQQPS